MDSSEEPIITTALEKDFGKLLTNLQLLKKCGRKCYRITTLMFSSVIVAF